jgi:hypothetical protein
MIDIVAGKIEPEFTIKGNTVPGKMKRVEICFVNNGVKVKLGNFLAIVN